MAKSNRVQDFLFGGVVFMCGYILFFTEYGFEYHTAVEESELQKSTLLLDKEVKGSRNIQVRAIEKQDHAAVGKTGIISVHRADLDNERFIYNEAGWVKVNRGLGATNSVQVRETKEEAQAASVKVSQRAEGSVGITKDDTGQKGDQPLSGVDNAANQRRLNQRHLRRIGKVQHKTVQPTESAKANYPETRGRQFRNASRSPFVTHEEKYRSAQLSFAGQWKKYSENKQTAAAILKPPRAWQTGAAKAERHINSNPAPNHGPSGVNEGMLEMLRKLEQEVLVLKAKLQSLDGSNGGVLNDTKAEIPDEKIQQPIKIHVANMSTITKSSTTLMKSVWDIPSPTFLPQFNNPCYVEKIDDSSTTKKYFRRAIRSCDTLPASYPYGKAIKALSDVPVTVVDQSGRSEDGFRLRCLPYFYLLGFPKCGTTDLRSRLMLHNYIRDALCKEPQYWDRRRFEKDINFADYLDLFNFGAQRIVSSEVNGYKPMLLGDFSTRTIGNEYYWERYPGNEGLPEAKYLTAHEIKHLNPHTKFIISMRNPTERLYSDYMHFRHESPEEFHNKVMASIKWWRTCVTSHSLRQCLYGQPHDMPALDPPGHYWTEPASAQIRTGFYIYYIVDWLELFPKEQFLFVEFKEYVEDEAGYITDVILPFLNLGPLEKQKEKTVKNRPKLNARYTHSSKAKLDMFPETRELLDNFYAPFNDRLADFLNDDKFRWHLRGKNQS